MDAVTILNNYRVAIVGDPEAIRILAELFRSGPQSEIQLKENSKANLRDLRVKLNDLYRAHLVCFVAGKRWDITDLADQILTRLGVAEVAAKSLLEEQRLTNPEKSFLQACLSVRSSYDKAWPKYQTALLRSLVELERNSWPDLHGSGAELRQLLYGAIVGLNTDAQQLGGQDYCKFVMDWHSGMESDLWNQWGSHWREDRSTYERRCDFGVKLALDSNALITSSEAQGLRKRPSRLTLLRLLGTMASETADPTMSTAFRFNSDLSHDIWKILAQTFSNLDERVGKVLLLWGKTEPTKSANSTKQLRSLLDQILWRDPGPGLTLLPAAGGATREDLTPMRGAWLEGTLLRLNAQIDAGDYDHLPSARKTKLLSLLEEARMAFSKRVSSAPATVVKDSKAAKLADAPKSRSAQPSLVMPKNPRR